MNIIEYEITASAMDNLKTTVSQMVQFNATAMALIQGEIFLIQCRVHSIAFVGKSGHSQYKSIVWN